MQIIDRTKYEAEAVNTVQAARIIGVSDTSVRNMIRSGALTAYQIGDRYAIRLDDIEDMLQRNRYCPNKK